MADFDSITVDSSVVEEERFLRSIEAGFTAKTVGLLSIEVLDSTHLKVNFTGPVVNNSALIQPGNYITSPFLEVFSVVPQAILNPTYVTLTVEEMKQGEDYELEIQAVEGA